MSKLFAAAIGAGCGYFGYKLGEAVEKDRKRRVTPDVALNIVPWEKRDEARQAAVHVAAVTGDSIDEVEVRAFVQFEGMNVYIFDSEFKGYGCIMYKDGTFEVSERIADWL